MDLSVIAEGIETELQRKILTKVGCDFGQGYLFLSLCHLSNLKRYLLIP
ncbi:EAL domain-containing protein [Candidatus Colwellia aromaticivorans]